MTLILDNFRVRIYQTLCTHRKENENPHIWLRGMLIETRHWDRRNHRKFCWGHFFFEKKFPYPNLLVHDPSDRETKNVRSEKKIRGCVVKKCRPVRKFRCGCRKSGVGNRGRKKSKISKISSKKRGTFGISNGRDPYNPRENRFFKGVLPLLIPKVPLFFDEIFEIFKIFQPRFSTPGFSWPEPKICCLLLKIGQVARKFWSGHQNRRSWSWIFAWKTKKETSWFFFRSSVSCLLFQAALGLRPLFTRVGAAILGKISDRDSITEGHENTKGALRVG